MFPLDSKPNKSSARILGHISNGDHTQNLDALDSFYGRKTASSSTYQLLGVSESLKVGTRIVALYCGG